MASNILICCTHTHSGPTSMPMRGVMGYLDQAWLESAKRKIVELVLRLDTELQPARLAYGSVQVSGIGHNRQDQSRANDEELIAVGVDSPDGSAIATLVNYATHAVVLGPSNLLYSGDFPGATAAHLERIRGGVGLYLQGACGDVDPVVYRDRGWGSGTFDDCEEMGSRLAAAAADVLASAERTKVVKLRRSSGSVEVPLDPPPTSEELAEMMGTFRADRENAIAAGNRAAELAAAAMISWAEELRDLLDRGSVPRTVPAEVFAAAIDDLRLVGLPFETYTDIGLRIKDGLKPLKTAFVGYANGLYGYCPTDWAKDQGGYGPDASCRWFAGLVTAVGYGADQMLIREAIEQGRRAGEA